MVSVHPLVSVTFSKNRVEVVSKPVDGVFKALAKPAGKDVQL
jgi:hypothetical protein